MSSPAPGRRHLDAFAGRDVVFCHQCEHEWYQDQHGLECPFCHSEATEIVTRENDPRDLSEPPPPPPDFGGNSFGLHRGHHDADSDPDEADIEDHITQLPGGGLFMERTYLPGRQPGSNLPEDAQRRRLGPTEGDAILQRFREMITHDFRGGPTGRSGPDTLFPPDGERGGTIFGIPRPDNIRTATFSGPTAATFSGPRFSGGTVGFTITSGPLPIRAGAAGGPFGFNDVFTDLFAGIGPPSPNGPNNNPNPSAGARAEGLPPGFPTALQQILASLLNPAAAVHGDAVFSQEALDRIITELMEANPQSNAAPPASQGAIERLEHKKVDDKMLGPEGHAECTICISDVERGEDVTVLPCKHWFHGECVTMWLKEHNTCPVCRAPIEGPPSRPTPPTRGPRGAPAQQPQEQSQAASTSQDATTSSSYRRRDGPGRSLRSPAENQERLQAIRNLASNSSRSSRTSERDQRRHSLSPPSPHAFATSEQSSRTRHRSPSPIFGFWSAGVRERERGRDEGWDRHRDSNRDRDRTSTTGHHHHGHEDEASHTHGSHSSGHDGGGGGGGSSGILNFLRNPFTRDSGNGSSGGNGNDSSGRRRS